MNENKRIQLREACVSLQKATEIIKIIIEEEQSSIDNVPENLQNGELYISMENAIDELEEAAENIERATENINNAL